MIVRFNEDGGTDFNGDSFSAGNLTTLRKSFPLFESEEKLSGSGSFGAFRFDCVGLVSVFSSSESMKIISAGCGEVWAGVDWVVEPKKECRVLVLPTGVVLPFLGLWERDMTWDEGGGRGGRAEERRARQ